MSARTPAHRLVIATRPKSYPPRPEVNRIKSGGKVEWKDDPGGEGVEIVKEILVCLACAGEADKAE
ncbi:MAG TPA: hypothetical protein PLD25_22830 [Chloroflexota bacterium]|nr:hypothetical protein [Chloroflexota bacterium]HUM71486.1 hypothetical protein [Chloroflexota bacterium]